MKKEVGKEPPVPDYPADLGRDTKFYSIPVSSRRSPVPATGSSGTDAAGTPGPTIASERQDATAARPSEHEKVSSTRKALLKSRVTDRASIRGPGKFRLLIALASGERACAILDQIVRSAETNGWTVESNEQGYTIVAEGETVGFMIEEKLDRVPHIVTAAELKEKAEYDRKCALADRGIGYRPWSRPSIPEHDHVPNGNLVLKFDQDYAASYIRRSFSDGKRQRLEQLVPAIIEAMKKRAEAVKARRIQDEKRRQEWADAEVLRKDRERQARVDGYRVAFLQRQIERIREIDGLSELIALWQEARESDPGFAELLHFARRYKSELEARVAPAAIAERVAALKLMDEDVYIYDAKRID